MKISIIGAGAMGGAFAEGLLKVSNYNAADITVANPTQSKLQRFGEAGINVTTDNKTAAKGSDIVVVAVKPWLVESVIDEIKDVLNYHRQILLVFAAGINSEQLKVWLRKKDAMLPCFLVIPNIAIAHRASMTFITSVSATPSHTALVKTMFDNLGDSIVVEERLLNAGTVLASCGIAYAMRYVRAASEGGIELGFKAHDAQQIVLQTMKGAVELLQRSGNHPEVEIDKVTTAGGITIKGLNEMEHAGFTSAVIRGLKAGMK